MAAGTTSADEATAAQRAAFVDGAAARALETPDAPRTPEGVERAWAASHREGRRDFEGISVLVLWNFDVASAVVKLEHQQALDLFFAPEILARRSRDQPASTLVVTGFASLTGGEQFNTTISGRRAQAVTSILTKRLEIAPGRITTNPPVGDKEQRDTATLLDVGEWYARNRRVRIERIAAPVPTSPSVFDEPPETEPQPSRQPAPEPSTLAPSREIAPLEFSFRVPPKGTRDFGGWVYMYATIKVVGKFTFVTPGSASSVGIKGAIELNDLSKRSIKADYSVKMEENIKLKLSADIERLSKDPEKGAGVKATIEFNESFSDVEIGFDFKEPRAPVLVSKSVKWQDQAEIDGQPVVFEGEVMITFNFLPGPRVIEKILAFGKQAIRGATVPAAGAAGEIGTAGTVGTVGAYAAAAVPVVILVVAINVGIVKSVKWAEESTMRNIKVIARRQGFALAVAMKVLGPSPETNSYFTSYIKNYTRIDAGVIKAFLEAISEAKGRIQNLEQEPEKFRQWCDAIRNKYGVQIDNLHHALFLALGGFEKGDPDAELHLADIPVQLP